MRGEGWEWAWQNVLSANSVQSFDGRGRIRLKELRREGEKEEEEEEEEKEEEKEEEREEEKEEEGEKERERREIKKEGGMGGRRDGGRDGRERGKDGRGGGMGRRDGREALEGWREGWEGREGGMGGRDGREGWEGRMGGMKGGMGGGRDGGREGVCVWEGGRDRRVRVKDHGDMVSLAVYLIMEWVGVDRVVKSLHFGFNSKLLRYSDCFSHSLLPDIFVGVDPYLKVIFVRAHF